MVTPRRDDACVRAGSDHCVRAGSLRAQACVEQQLMNIVTSVHTCLTMLMNKDLTC